MFQIFETTLDAGGALVSCGSLPIHFANKSDATRFMNQYLTMVFASGKSGYQLDDGYWWGCHDTPEVELHRYTIEQ
jgi:hypothetical protein